MKSKIFYIAFLICFISAIICFIRYQQWLAYMFYTAACFFLLKAFFEDNDDNKFNAHKN